MSADPPSERRASTAEFHQIATCYHLLDKRVAILETRIDAQDHRLHDIELRLERIGEAVQSILDKLGSHILRDVEMHRQVLFWVVATMISASFAAISVVGKYLLLDH